jgi:hypothetical protein
MSGTEGLDAATPVGDEPAPPADSAPPADVAPAAPDPDAALFEPPEMEAITLDE